MSVAQTRTRELELVHNQHVVEDVVSPWRLIEVEGESDETMVGDVARMAASLDGKFFGCQICGNPQLQATYLKLVHPNLLVAYFFIHGFFCGLVALEVRQLHGSWECQLGLS